MEYESVYLARKELCRFMEIANGDNKASNTPEEDALFQKKLVEERMMAFINLDDGSSYADQRAIVLSNLGKEYYAQYMNERRKIHREDRRYWLSTALTIMGITVAIAAIVVPYILSMSE